jgi:predicted RNA-binding protein with PIN domain
VVDDSIEGLQALLQQPRICVFVDGYNVSKSAWPRSAIAEQRILLVSFLGEIRTRFGPEIHVVFDGDSRGERPTSRTSLPVRVHFTSSGVEADDRILEFLEQLDSTRPALVITSDQRVRNGARARGANVVSSAVLLKLRR